jgi:hypothetical protein
MQIATRDATVAQLQGMISDCKQQSAEALQSLQGRLQASERARQSQTAALDRAQNIAVCPASCIRAPGLRRLLADRYTVGNPPEADEHSRMLLICGCSVVWQSKTSLASSSANYNPGRRMFDMHAGEASGGEPQDSGT